MSKNYSNLNVISEKNHRSLFAFILAALISTSAYNAQAAVFLWNNTGTQWTSGTSWVGGVSPTATSSSTTTDDIQFGSLAAGFNSVQLTSTRAAAGMTFLAGANAYTLAPSAAQILSISKGLTNNSTATQTFSISLENANANNTWTQVAGGSLVFNNNVGLTTASSSSSRTLTLAGGGTFTFNNSITQGLSTGGKLTVNNAGGVVNLNAANTMGGGTVISAGTVNVRNAQALGTGILELGATAGTSYGNSILNNATGAALTLTGLTGVTWSGTAPAGIQIGTATSTYANNIDFGSGLVTTTTSRAMNIAGTGVTISMGTLTTTGTSNGYTYTFDGTGNTMDLDGWRISTAATPTQNVVHQIKGSASVTIGAIENGTAGFVNGAEFNSDGGTRLTGNNTYTGTTTFLNGTNIVSGNNSAAVGNVSIGGSSGSGKTPVVRLNNVNAISSASGISGSSSSTVVGTMDFNAATAYTLNSYNGGNMIFTNSFGQASVVTFTNASSLLTSSAGSSGGRSLQNNSSNLKIVFDGNLDIGSSSTDTVNTLGGAGDFVVKGNIFSTTVGSVRGLSKTGAGLLEMRGANNSYNGDTQVWNGTLSVTNGALLTGSTVKLNAGTLNVDGTVGAVVQTNGTYNLRGTAGALTLSGGAATVFSGGTLGNTRVTNTGSVLVVNGTAGNVQVDNGGSLGGSGTVGAVTLANGSFLKPGNSPGLLTAASSSWAAGAIYNWEIDSNASSAVAGTNWDLFSVTGTGAIDMSALSLNSQMNLVLNSLSGFDLTSSTNREWVIAQAGSLLGTGGTVLTAGENVSDYFNINATAFNAGTPSLVNEWRVEVGATGKTLNLMAIPEPSTGSMLGLGLAGLVAARLLRRKNS
jgi:autotransporter-associated beta strand protein